MLDNSFDEIVLLNDEGEEERFVHILTYAYEGDRYVALSPASEADTSEEMPVIILRIVDDDGIDIYQSIDNEVLEEEVYNAFLDLVDEMDEDDD